MSPNAMWAHRPTSRRAGATAIGDLTVIGGVDVERQDNRSERYNTAAQVRTARTRDQQFDFNTVGAFAQAVIRPVKGLTITPALRFDQIRGSYANALNGQTYSVNNYGTISQPKLSAVYALSERTSVYGNVGARSGSASGLDRTRSTDQRSAPSVNDGWELGVIPAAALARWRLSAWRQAASNEARRNSTIRPTTRRHGKTRRQGIDLQLLPSRRRSGMSGRRWHCSFQILLADAASARERRSTIAHLLFN
jgi:iron complex outermembrane receptor protein